MDVLSDDLASEVGEAIKNSLTKCNTLDSLCDQKVSISIEVKISKKSNERQVQTFLDESCWAIDPRTGRHVRVPCEE